MENKKRTFCVGDIHGGYLGLKQVLDKVNFDFDNDRLISLGDATDGWSQTLEAIELLLKVKDLVYIKGNHDEWTTRFLYQAVESGPRLSMNMWTAQGGDATYKSYNKDKDLELITKHIDFLNKGKLYHIENDKIFLHAGFNPDKELNEQEFIDVGQTKDENALFYWDRKLWRDITSKHYRGEIVNYDNYDEIYIGHTPTTRTFKDGLPVNIGNVWNLDTGAAYDGKITIMDINTKEYHQSEPLYKLYKGEMGRNGVYLNKEGA